VADFGLAVHESAQRRLRGERSGTPAYMSPERSELFEEIQHREPRPPREIEPELPAELERLKCLSKRVIGK
jgi:serine/threonine protein kinase